MTARETTDFGSVPRENGCELLPTPRSIDDPQIIELISHYREALFEGRQPDREALLSQYPQIAEELSACLDALEMVRGVAKQ